MILFRKLICKIREHKWIYVYTAPTGITHRMRDLPNTYLCERCGKKKLLFPEVEVEKQLILK